MSKITELQIGKITANTGMKNATNIQNMKQHEIKEQLSQ